VPMGLSLATAVLLMDSSGNSHDFLSNTLLRLEAHAALVQALAAIVSMMIATVALTYAVNSLRTMQRQTEAAIAMTTETFRPIIEVLGGSLGATCHIDFVNKGNGVALNFRWKEDCVPERWRGYTTNVIAPQERGALIGKIDWEKGLVLAYNSVAHREEIYTRVTFGSTGAVANTHDISQGAAMTRQGWTLLDPKLVVPAYHPEFIRSMPLLDRATHWWGLKRGKERRL
jgi:hypothetical protein